MLSFIKHSENKQWIAQYPEIEKIESFLKKEKQTLEEDLDIFPEEQNIFRCFNYFDITKTKVVILGQDPYHTKGCATGLCFGVPNDKKIPPSLRNIKKELLEDVGKKLTDTTLEEWAKQGVLLMNTAFTVREKSAASHMKIWKPFTKYIVDLLKKRNPDIVWVAWGAFANNMIGDVEKKIVSSHPSPLSYKKKYKVYPMFYGSKPFSKINALLNKKIFW
jgi:uracil-DNA glycosylase